MTSCETPTSQEASSQNSRPNIRGKTDIAWAHCKLIPEGDKIAMMFIVIKFLGEVELID